MEFFLVSVLNGLSYGLLLFLLSAGLTLILSMMGVLNFAHAGFYMVGAYVGYTVSYWVGFWPALLLAPLLVGLLGALFERIVLRKVHNFGHIPELLITFGLSYILLELVQLIWGRAALEFKLPAALQGPAFTLISHDIYGWWLVWGASASDLCASVDVQVRVICSPFPMTRAFIMVLAMTVLLALWMMLTRSRIGLVIRAALTHPEMVGALGHNVPRVFMLVFGVGTGLAGLAGVIGGSIFVTEPAMAATLGSVVFVVVVVGGMGSLSGAFAASLLIGVIQTLAVTLDYALLETPLVKLTVAQIAPILPYLFLVLTLIFRPKGLLGKRES